MPGEVGRWQGEVGRGEVGRWRGEVGRGEGEKEWERRQSGVGGYGISCEAIPDPTYHCAPVALATYNTTDPGLELPAPSSQAPSRPQGYRRIEITTSATANSSQPADTLSAYDPPLHRRQAWLADSARSPRLPARRRVWSHCTGCPPETSERKPKHRQAAHSPTSVPL